LPEVVRFVAEKGGVEFGKPREAELEMFPSGFLATGGVAGGIEVFEDEEKVAVFTVASEELGDAGELCAAGAPILIPSAFILVGTELSLVREGAVPASGMFVLCGGIDVLDDDALQGGEDAAS